MGFKCGIVGLPNVGKSTLFNALTKTAAAQAANYPFCTIEPNVGEVAMPEPRLQKLAAIAGSKAIIPTRMNFVDIAGLVRRASKGEGLGNQFLDNIRECDAIAYVLRCFENDDITHVEGSVDPGPGGLPVLGVDARVPGLGRDLIVRAEAHQLARVVHEHRALDAVRVEPAQQVLGALHDLLQLVEVRAAPGHGLEHGGIHLPPRLDVDVRVGDGHGGAA